MRTRTHIHSHTNTRESRHFDVKWSRRHTGNGKKIKEEFKNIFTKLLRKSKAVYPPQTLKKIVFFCRQKDVPAPKPIHFTNRPSTATKTVHPLHQRFLVLPTLYCSIGLYFLSQSAIWILWTTRRQTGASEVRFLNKTNNKTSWLKNKLHVQWNRRGKVCSTRDRRKVRSG